MCCLTACWRLLRGVEVNSTSSSLVFINAGCHRRSTCTPGCCYTRPPECLLFLARRRAAVWCRRTRWRARSARSRGYVCEDGSDAGTRVDLRHADGSWGVGRRVGAGRLWEVYGACFAAMCVLPDVRWWCLVYCLAAAPWRAEAERPAAGVCGRQARVLAHAREVRRG